MNKTSRYNNLSPAKLLALRILGVIIGIVLGAFLFFQILFLAKVLPHGGI